MTLEKDVKHTGRVISINNNSIVVTINDDSTCTSCSLNNTCRPRGNNSKEITLHGVENVELYSINDRVKVIVTMNMQKMAIIIALAIPCLLLVATLFITSYFINLNESISAISCLAILALYYILIYAKRDTLMKKYNLTIKKI